ncbi:hypothetical protein BDY21DRAFT_374917 [Lineolata rhizophorae]|uniref:Uncharacterized protein n=1 Tax=Lineolata rhizophorae TaxID=578093 RepID=A0A6A6NNV5_9PEZI|nr:hypothetical protein BDY21DRAFT_374917 [Lineolata rhizophorae]
MAILHTFYSTTRLHPRQGDAAPSDDQDDSSDDSDGISGLAIFFIVLLILLILGSAGYLVYVRLRARRLGLPPPPLNPFSRSSSSGANPGLFPAPAPGGVVGWFGDKLAALRNRRSARGAYESAGLAGSGGGAGAYAGGGARARGRQGHALDPDEAWDARVGGVGQDAYYEEQELGLRGPAGAGGAAGAEGYYGAGDGGAYGGGAAGGGAQAQGPYGASPYAEAGGRDSLDERYEEEVGRGRLGGQLRGQDPFGDAAERSDMSLRGVSPRPLDTSVQGGGGAGQKGDGSPTERRSMFRENM